LGPYPNPREQPRSRGWLRVRFTNAVVPATAGTGGAFAPWRAGEAADTALLEKEKRGWSVPLAAIG